MKYYKIMIYQKTEFGWHGMSNATILQTTLEYLKNSFDDYICSDINRYDDETMIFAIINNNLFFIRVSEILVSSNVEVMESFNTTPLETSVFNMSRFGFHNMKEYVFIGFTDKDKLKSILGHI